MRFCPSMSSVGTFPAQPPISLPTMNCTGSFVPPHVWAARLVRPHTYTTLFTLLAVTGLRPAEAYALRRDDLTRDGLTIRETKFRKSRLVPIHDPPVSPWNTIWSTAVVSPGMTNMSSYPWLNVPHRVHRLRLFRQLLQAAGLPDRPGDLAFTIAPPVCHPSARNLSRHP